MNPLALFSLPRRLEELAAAIINQIQQTRRENMSIKTELLDAIAAEREQVLAAIAALEAKVGSTLTPEDVAEIKATIAGIYEAPQPEPTPEG